MKKFMILFVLFVLTSNNFAKNEIDVIKFNGWLRAALDVKISNSEFGAYFMFGSRYNFTLKKEINGSKVSATTQDAFLQELHIGPSWQKMLLPKLFYNTKLLYHPQVFYIDDVAGQQFTRHTFDWHNNFFYNLGSFKILYRLILWNWIPQGDETPDYKLYKRNLLGVIIPFNKTISFFLGNEVWLNLTTNKEIEEEFFFRNLLMIGFNMNFSKDFNMMIRYLYSYSNISDGNIVEMNMNDHYIRTTFTYKLNL